MKARLWTMTLTALALLGGVPASAQTADWQTKPLAVVTSELSPVVMVHTARSTLTLFGNLQKWGLGAPTHLALRVSTGVRGFDRAGADGSVDVPTQDMKEPWMLVWFRGAAGWTRWDSPWLVVWQRRPDTVTLDGGGLHAQSRAALGYVALLPLYGLYKPATQGWRVPNADALRRCRFWARAVRAYPLACDESYRIDPGTDSVVVQDEFHWLSTQDAWRTKPLKFAPMSPTLALAYESKRMPMSVSGRLRDAGLFTAYGPYLGVHNADSYTVRFPILHYITQTEQEQTPDTTDPVVAAALARLRSTMRTQFSSPDGLFHQDFGDPKGFAAPPPQHSDNGNTCWALVADQFYCRALPYVSEDLAAKAKPRLHRYFADWVLQPGRFKPYKGKLLLVGPGIGDFGSYGDAGKFSSNALITLWTYGHYTGDWALLKDRWPLIQKLFVTPRECTWRGFGRDGIAEMGDEAAPALAMARLAWFVGDKDTFGYAAYIFARELVHHVVKDTGTAYFFKRQPDQSAERMPPDVYPTNLWGDLAGWQIDGPTYPRQAGDRQYTNRWVRFSDPDVARFHRDFLEDLDRHELDSLLASGRLTTARKGGIDDAHIMPSMVRLRSLLLDEPPDRLAQITPVKAPASAPSGALAYCLSFLRTSHPPQFAALIPADETQTEWAQGIERDRPSDEPVLAATVQGTVGKPPAPGPPAVTWWGWKPPKTDTTIPGGDRWSFGQILVGQPPASAKTERLSWNTQALTFTF